MQEYKNPPLGVVGLCEPKACGALGKEGPKVALSGNSHEQITHDKTDYKAKREPSYHYGTLPSPEWAYSDLRWVMSDMEWAPQARIGPSKASGMPT